MATVNPPYAFGFRQDTQRGDNYITPYALLPSWQEQSAPVIQYKITMII